MRDWQFNILFFIGTGGAVTLLFGPELGLQTEENPLALTGVGAILAYILKQKLDRDVGKHKKNSSDEEEDDDGSA